MIVRVKVCGVTNREDAVKAVELGASAVGFIFYKKSPRKISAGKAKRIIEQLPPFVTPVGIFVNETLGAIRDIIKHTGIKAVQLHGDESYHDAHRLKRYGVDIIKAFRINDSFHFDALEPYKVDAFLFDTYSKDEFGGTGETFDWSRLRELKTRTPVIISGGLDQNNVCQLLDGGYRPYAVDVNSSIEVSPGIKDHRKMRGFIEVVQFISGPKVS